MIDQATQAQAIHRAFDDTNVTVHSRPAALAEFRSTGHQITFDQNGEPFTTYDSVPLPLAEAFTRFLMDHKYHADGRTLPKEGVGFRRGPASKADFKSNREKADYINDFGEDAFVKLPLQAPPETQEVKTQEDFRRLPLSEKVAMVEADPDIVRKLPKAPATHPFAKALNQKQVMADNLAREIAKRGARRA